MKKLSRIRIVIDETAKRTGCTALEALVTPPYVVYVWDNDTQKIFKNEYVSTPEHAFKLAKLFAKFHPQAEGVPADIVNNLNPLS